jgi:hypothetical protein
MSASWCSNDAAWPCNYDGRPITVPSNQSLLCGCAVISGGRGTRLGYGTVLSKRHTSKSTGEYLPLAPVNLSKSSCEQQDWNQKSRAAQPLSPSLHTLPLRLVDDLVNARSRTGRNTNRQHHNMHALGINVAPIGLPRSNFCFC